MDTRVSDEQPPKVTRVWAFPPWAMVSFVIIAIFNAGVSYSGLEQVKGDVKETKSSVQAISSEVKQNAQITEANREAIRYLDREVEALRRK